MPANEALVVRIVSAGTPLQLGFASHLLEFSYEDSEKKDDFLQCSFADPYRKLSDSDQFQQGAEWSVQWGFAGKLYPPRKVILREPEISDGILNIKALDKGTLLKSESAWTNYTGKSIEQIIQEIAERNNLRPIFAEIPQIIIDNLPQAGMTDYQVLSYLRNKVENHIIKVINDELHFEPRKMNFAPVGGFAFGRGRDSRIVEYSISEKDLGRTKSNTQITGITVDPYTGKSKRFTADEGNTTSENLGNKRTLASFLKKHFKGKISDIDVPSVVTDLTIERTGSAVILPPLKDKEIENLLTSTRRQGLDASVEASFTIIADRSDTFYRSGDLIDGRDLGKRHTGIYKIDSITHDLNAGYTYKINATRNAVRAKGNVNGPVNKKFPYYRLRNRIEKPVKGTNSGETKTGIN